MANLRIGEELRARIASVWPTLLSRIAAGAIIGRELDALGISRDSVRCYLASTPDARTEWDEARLASADAFNDDISEMAYTEAFRDPKGARVAIDALRWIAARRNPKVYGDKQELNLNVRTVDLTKIIQDANARLASSRQPALIDHATQRVLLDQTAIEQAALAALL